eukprot:scaffold135815_cov32-Tisochrysis_lutea.AAC.1
MWGVLEKSVYSTTLIRHEDSYAMLCRSTVHPIQRSFHASYLPRNESQRPLAGRVFGGRRGQGDVRQPLYEEIGTYAPRLVEGGMRPLEPPTRTSCHEQQSIEVAHSLGGIHMQRRARRRPQARPCSSPEPDDLVQGRRDRTDQAACHQMRARGARPAQAAMVGRVR